jgi:hypothetical protein
MSDSRNDKQRSGQQKPAAQGGKKGSSTRPQDEDYADPDLTKAAETGRDSPHALQRGGGFNQDRERAEQGERLTDEAREDVAGQSGQSNTNRER